MPPRNGPPGSADECAESVQDFNLIGQCLLDRPPGGGIRRAAQGVTSGQKVSTCDRVADIFGWIRKSRHHISVAVENQGPIPVRRNLNQVLRTVRKLTPISLSARRPGVSNG